MVNKKGVDITSEEGFVIHLGFDLGDKLMYERFDRFHDTVLVDQAQHYMPDNGVPCYVIDCGEDYDKIIECIDIIDRDVIGSEKAEFEVEYWYL